MPELPQIAEALDLKTLWLKNESVNPTWSFKDRGSFFSVLRAKKLGFKKIGVVSSGNNAASASAFAAAFGMRAYIMVLNEIPQEKLNPVAIYGSTLIKVKGRYDDMYDVSLKIGEEQGLYIINSDEPFRVDGYRTLAFEVCEQTAFNPPDYVVVPTGSGGHFMGILRGFLDMQASGIIERVPTMVCAQTSGCATICNSFDKGLTQIERTEHSTTVLHEFENPFPPSGQEVMAAIRQYGGFCVQVSDRHILDCQKKIANKGLFLQPASAAPLAAVEKLRKQNLIPDGARIALVGTATGLKYTAALDWQDLSSHVVDINDLGQLIRDLG